MPKTPDSEFAPPPPTPRKNSQDTAYAFSSSDEEILQSVSTASVADVMNQWLKKEPNFISPTRKVTSWMGKSSSLTAIADKWEKRVPTPGVIPSAPLTKGFRKYRMRASSVDDGTSPHPPTSKVSIQRKESGYATARVLQNKMPSYRFVQCTRY